MRFLHVFPCSFNEPALTYASPAGYLLNRGSQGTECFEALGECRYRVVYSDGDEEDLALNELQPFLVDATPNAPSGPVRTAPPSAREADVAAGTECRPSLLDVGTRLLQKPSGMADPATFVTSCVCACV